MTQLYTMAPAAAEIEDVPVLIHALHGAMDAGRAGALVARHLEGTLGARRVATFDPDELIDYRARRPVMTFEDGRWTEYAEPTLALDLLHDDEGTPLLLLHGPEPDLRWEGFVAAVTELVERFGVQRTIGIHGIPMAVPHTRPTTVTAHATDASLIPAAPDALGTLQVPGSAAALLELRLGRSGHDALGFAANVPHYLAQSEFPQAAAELVRQVARSSGLALPVGELEAAAVEAAADIDRQVAASAEVGAVVHALEQQFDAFMAGADRAAHGTLLAQPVELPTAEEIGAELEAFLADHGPGDGDDDNAS
ncbi:proteasome assembly chaperone family protein [Georgenia faecalis]|uniref:Proteasome assembly chaperone family protein n=1 Tax=Georgenia faecalis TaxID=2483799 RepID=A0ABV9DC57_9MICO|nr:PAC2 family protein [Georgenia faecalis]